MTTSDEAGEFPIVEGDDDGLDDALRRRASDPVLGVLTGQYPARTMPISGQRADRVIYDEAKDFPDEQEAEEVEGD